MAWQYDRRTRRYRNTATGRLLGQKDLARLRDTFTDRLADQAAELGRRLAEGEIDLTNWEGAMREVIKVAHVDLAALGKGGRGQMRPADWGRVGLAIRRQYAYLAGFANEATGMAAGQVATRARMYVGAAATSYERAHAAAWRVQLPAYPGQDSECLVNCRCAWELVDVPGGVRATWHASGDDRTCATCGDRANRWVDLFIPRPSDAELEAMEADDLAAGLAEGAELAGAEA